MAYSPAPTNTVADGHTTRFLSLYSSELEPQVVRKLYKDVGKQFDILDFLRLNGQEISLTRDSITTFAEGARSRPVKIKTEVTALSDSKFKFYIDPDDYDSNDKAPVRIGDSIMIPGYFFGKTYDVQARITAVGASDTALTTAEFFESGLSLANNFPADGYIQVGPTTYGRGSGQPQAKSRGFYSDTFYTAISKESVQMHGGVNAQQLYFEVEGKGGGKGLWSMAWADAEFSLDEQISTELWQGHENGNSLTETDVDSNNSTIKGTKGLWLHAAADGADHQYVDAFSVKDLDAIYDLFRATGVVCESASLLTGDKLNGQIQEAAHDYISQYSGGSDLLMDNMTALGFTAHKWNRRGIDFKLVNLAQLSNPNTFGANNKNFWTYAGLALPDEMVSVEDREMGIANSYGKVTLPNVTVGYLNNNQEDRKRIITDVAGVNGFGFKATSQYDQAQLFLLSEYALISVENTKMVRLMKEGTY